MDTRLVPKRKLLVSGREHCRGHSAATGAAIALAFVCLSSEYDPATLFSFDRTSKQSNAHISLTTTAINMRFVDLGSPRRGAKIHLFDAPSMSGVSGQCAEGAGR